MSHVKKQEKTPERELNEGEVSNLPGTASKMLVMRIPKELSESFNRDIASGKKDIETVQEKSQKWMCNRKEECIRRSQQQLGQNRGSNQGLGSQGSGTAHQKNKKEKESLP